MVAELSPFPAAVLDLAGLQADLTLRREYDAKVAEMVAVLQRAPQVEMPVVSRFSPGVYIREILMPENTFVIGHRHKTRHFNVIVAGVARVMMNGEIREVKAGDVFESEGGVQKILFIFEEMRWLTIHANPDECRDVPALEERLVELPDALLLEKGSRTLDEFRMSLAQTLAE